MAAADMSYDCRVKSGRFNFIVIQAAGTDV